MREHDFITIAKQIRVILDEYFQQEDLLWKRASEVLDDNLFYAIYALSHACNMTTDSCYILAKESRIYDASILRRTIIHATLKMVYLLSASDKNEEMSRLSEYVELLPKKQFASIEQPIKAAFNAGRYGDGVKALFIKENFLEYIDNHKTQPNEGKNLNSIKKKWGYKNLSPYVSKECPQWKEVCLRMDTRYSAANDYVHWNATGCFEIMVNLAKATGSQRFSNLLSHCFPLDILLDLCALECARIEVLSGRLGEQHKGLDAIIRRNKAWLKSFGAFQEETRQMMAKEANN